MTKSIEDNVRNALRALTPPGEKDDIVTLGLVREIQVLASPDGARVAFAVEVDPADGAAMEPLRFAAENAARAVAGVASVSAVLTAHRKAPDFGAKHGGGVSHERQAHVPQKIPLAGVTRILAVASGKGGVGKSTTAANLAVAFSQGGMAVGLLDADIYGPSVPRLLGLRGKPEADAQKKLVPHMWNGIAVMSMGFLIPENAPMIWRGPMVHTAVTQLFRDVAWGTLDMLVVDLPPGTGDAQLTMAQSVPLSGAVIVSTPQDLALIDARKGLAMFEKVGVPVLGIIENMSYFSCPHCKERSDIFGHGGARREAQETGMPFLGEIPLDIAIRHASDEGAPVAHAAAEGPLARIYRDIAARIMEEMEGE